MKLFASRLPQIDCGYKKCAIIVGAGKSSSTNIACKVPKRLKAAPCIVRVSIGDKYHREVLEMRLEGMQVVLSGMYQLLNILEYNMMKDERRILLLSRGASNVMFGRPVLCGREFGEQMMETVHKYAGEGIRSQALPYCGFDEGRYKGTAGKI